MQPSYSIEPDALTHHEIRFGALQHGDLVVDNRHRSLFGRKVESTRRTPRGSIIVELNHSAGLVAHETVVVSILRPSWDIGL